MNARVHPPRLAFVRIVSPKPRDELVAIISKNLEGRDFMLTHIGLGAYWDVGCQTATDANILKALFPRRLT